MTKKISLATAALFSASALMAAAQNSSQTGTTAGKPSAYGNAYSSQYTGTSNPSDAPITATARENAQTDAAPAVPSSARTTQPFAAAPLKDNQNPDYGIVTTPVPDEGRALSYGNRPALRPHVENNPDADIVTEVPGDPNQLPEGTPFHARLVEEISAAFVTPGTPFTAQMTRDVVHSGKVVVPTGSYIHGRVTYVSAGRRIGGQSTLRLTPDEVVLPDGTHYHFRGLVTQTAGSNSKTDSEGYIINKDHVIRTASETGMTVGSGAVIGAVVGGPVGAGVGSLVGAGVMTVHWLREKNAAVLPAGSMVTFALSSPIGLTPTNSPAEPSAYSAPAVESPAPPVAAYVEPKVVN